MTKETSAMKAKRALQAAAYAYNFWARNGNVEEYVVLEQLDYFCNQLRKEDKLKKVLESYISLMVKFGRITPFVAKKGCKAPFHPRAFRLERSYEEDNKIAEEYSRGTIGLYSEMDVDICRAYYFGHKIHSDCDLAVTQLIAATFFGAKLPQTEREMDSPPLERIGEKIAKVSRSFDEVKFLKDAMRLSEEEAAFLQAAYSAKENEFVEYLFKREDTIVNLCRVCDMDYWQGKCLLRAGEKLVDYGLMNLDGTIPECVVWAIKEQSLDAYFRDVLSKQKVDDSFDLDSFAVDKKAKQNLAFFLKGDVSANLLLYGRPGSGKTEFAKALAKAYGLDAYVYKNETEISKKEDEGFHSLARLNCLLSFEKKNSVIIVDEAETLLKTRSFMGTSLAQKGAVNQMLDKNNNKVIWILNYTRESDESTKRRMTYSVRFDGIGDEAMRKIAKSELEKAQVNEALRKKVVALFSKYKVTGASVKNVVKTLKTFAAGEMTKAQEKEAFALAEDVLKANATLVYGKEAKKKKSGVCDQYSEIVLNTSVPADKIVQMIKNAAAFDKKRKNSRTGIRILLYGLSGAGKTEFVKHIAQSLKKNVVLKRPSDIFDSFVGETEKNIKEAFEEADVKNSILFFDEADSFFSNRADAARNWERTQVNEFLVQMEEFDGLCVCATNLKDIMDPAMQRRFHMLVEFKPLKEEGVRTLLKNYFGNLDFTQEQVDAITRWQSATPGDFAQLYGRIRFMDADAVNSDFVADELQQIQKEKSFLVNGKVVGFCA